MANLIGTYDCKADAKGRLMFPAAFKKQLAHVLQDGFVIKKSIFEPCLELYPMKEWGLMMAKVNKLNRFVKKNNDFVRMVTAGSKMLDLDVSGRLLIPKDLCALAGVEKQLILTSAGNIIEIWDKTKYEKVVNDATIDFAGLAEEVMGNFDVDELS